MDPFAAHLERWALVPDGEAIATRSSRLLPVARRGQPLMLKIAFEWEERWGAGLMVWWDGIGAARVLEHDADAILMERATGRRSLAAMADAGEDGDETACGIICEAVAELHRPRASAPPELIPLEERFTALMARRGESGILALCAATARRLLDQPQEVVPLHGDIHHGNILDFGRRGWLAIDPKRLIGERAFDYANLFCNPTLELATQEDRLVRRVEIVSRAAVLDRRRLLQWIIAWAGLSALWSIEDGQDREVEPTLRVAQIAAGLQDASGFLRHGGNAA